jgi:hypothetical protein
MHQPFTPDEIEDLSAQVDQQLMGVLAKEGTFGLRTTRGADSRPLEKQREAIERATGEDARTFLARFRAAARRDVCEQGGVIYEQWQKWRDVTNRDVLKSFGAVLVGMGLSGSALQIAVVALAVYVLYLGIQAFCADGADSDRATGDAEATED